MSWRLARSCVCNLHRVMKSSHSYNWNIVLKNTGNDCVRNWLQKEREAISFSCNLITLLKVSVREFEFQVTSRSEWRNSTAECTINTYLKVCMGIKLKNPRMTWNTWFGCEPEKILLYSEKFYFTYGNLVVISSVKLGRIVPIILEAFYVFHKFSAL